MAMSADDNGSRRATAPVEDDDHEDDIPDYDDLIESALDSLDVYQARCADMNKHLKNAYFNLAQAKQALGPARVGPASYRLGRTEPLLTVNISTAIDGSIAYSLVEAKPAQRKEVDDTKSKGKQRATGSTIDLRLDASTSALKLEDDAITEKSGSQSLRKRVKNVFHKDKKNNIYSSQANGRADQIEPASQSRTDGIRGVEPLGDTADVNNSGSDVAGEKGGSEQPPPTYSDSVNEYLMDPMQQFSAFPPVTLRKAQNEFRHGIRIGLKVLEDQQNFDKLRASAMSSKSPEKGFR